jgi:hypothetical protein
MCPESDISVFMYACMGIFIVFNRLSIILVVCILLCIIKGRWHNNLWVNKSNINVLLFVLFYIRYMFRSKWSSSGGSHEYTLALTFNILKDSDTICASEFNEVFTPLWKPKILQSIYIVYWLIWIHVGEQFSNNGVYSCEPPDVDHFDRNM